jgi:transcriptional regulator with XRE-family HTH domain
MSMQQITSSHTGSSFSDRIRLLIQRVGSATEIARMCGFSEGVVRSWRDGNTDPSRARCVTLAKTLGISLVWLVAGEGAIQVDPTTGLRDDQYSSEMVKNERPRNNSGSSITHLPLPSKVNGLDAQRLNTAMQILQSELDLASRQLSMTESTGLLSELYEILGPGGVSMDAHAMMAFNRRLNDRLHRTRDSA